MGLTLIFAWKGSHLKSRRSTKEEELQKEGWGASLTEEQIDKAKYLERQAYKQGIEKPFPAQHIIDKVK